MRKILILLLFPAFAAAQTKSKEFTVTVKLDSIKVGEKLYLEFPNTSDPQGHEITDSVVFREDKIVFKGKINEPTAAKIYWYKKHFVDSALQRKVMEEIKLPEDEMEEFLAFLLNPLQKEFFEFFLMPGEITIRARKNLFYAQAEGPKPVTDLIKLKKEGEKFTEKQFSPKENMLQMVAYGKNDTAYLEKMAKKRDSVEKRMLDEVYLGYVRANPSSPLALYALKKGMPHRIDSADKYINLFSTLSKEIKQWPSAIRLIETLKATKNAETGRTISDFKQLDSLGKTVKFSSFKGQYVLIEFWASWCGPCRRKNPELIRTFDKYSNEKFTILGVALEQKEDKEKWLKAIHKDKLKWPQLTDYKYWDNAVARQFGIRSIPFNLLVDPNGKILGSNLYGEELDNRLAEIFRK